MDIYRERSYLVAHLASLYPSHWIIDEMEPEWPVVVIQTPTGQMTWHIASKDLDLFEHVTGTGAYWDGHTTEEKYERLRALTAK
jgi:hypothetical protein